MSTKLNSDCCPECAYWSEEEHKNQLDAWTKILQAQPRKPLYDFGWNLEHVAEPRDEVRHNQ